MLFLLQILIATMLGILVGTISGLTPGIHINMISVIVLSMSPFLIINYHIHIVTFGVFIIALGITHTFLDAIPSIFLGAPNEDTALGVLPGHRYLLHGNGYMAVKLFTIGSFFGLVFAIIAFPILIWLTNMTYTRLEPFFAVLLIITSLIMIFRDHKMLWAMAVFSISGIFGILIFQWNVTEPLFPLFAGLFGVSTLLVSLKDKNTIPPQQVLNHTVIDRKKSIISISCGNISAYIVSTFPGLSSSIAAMLSTQIARDLKDQGFMVLLGCIGTTSFILSLVALYTIDKARNGAVIVIAKLITINQEIVLLFLIVALIAGAIATIICLSVGVLFANLITKINYQKVVITIIIATIILVYMMGSWKGLFILVVATALGIIPAIVKIQRTQAMGCLIVPIIVFLL